MLGADTTVVVDGEVLGKPRDAGGRRRDARPTVGPEPSGPDGRLSHRAGGGRAETAVATTTVEFRPLTDAEIDEYVASGEPMDKAGAYAIQGGAGGFVTRIDGEFDNVVGLPVALILACAGLGNSGILTGVRGAKVLTYEQQSREDRIVTGVVLATAFGVLLYSSLGESLQYYKYVDEVMVEQQLVVLSGTIHTCIASDLETPRKGRYP